MNKFSYDEAFEIIITKPTAKAKHVTLVEKKDLSKHLAGRHNQKTHGGGMGPKWEKGEWHEMSDTDYVSFISDSYRLATSKEEKREISKTEWKNDYAEPNRVYLEDKPARSYKNGQIVVFSEPGPNPNPLQTRINEASLMRDIDDLQEKYPLPALVLHISDKRVQALSTEFDREDALGLTSRGGNKMLLASDALNPRVGQMDGMGMSTVIGMRTYILTHEWGHAVDRPQIEARNFASQDAIISTLLNQEYDGKIGTSFMSGYGNSKEAEAFAEGFAQYVLQNQKNVPMTNPLVSAMATKFGWDKPWAK